MGKDNMSGAALNLVESPLKSCLKIASLAAALLLPAAGLKAEESSGTFLPRTAIEPTGDSAVAAKTDRPLFFDDAPAPPVEQPNIHGFFNSPFKTAYVTPRGLVVENEGLVWQPIVGLVFPIGDLGPLKHFTTVAGIWNSVNTHQSDPFVGAWNEMDVFVSLSGTVADVVSLNLTYSPWNSPPHAFHTEHNMDLKISYDDSKLWGSSGFSINPYVDLWWAMAGDSTVILGRKGGTGYFEPGIVPTYTWKASPDFPLTFTLPMYVQIGPSTYWDASKNITHSDFGVASIGANVSVPLGMRMWG
jgi:hypothetical protein